MKITHFWLSFRDPKLNKNLGCAIICSESLDDAVKKAWELKINPGGEVVGFPLSDEEVKDEGLECNRLYSKKELIELGYKPGI